MIYTEEQKKIIADNSIEYYELLTEFVNMYLKAHVFINRVFVDKVRIALNKAKIKS